MINQLNIKELRKNKGQMACPFMTDYDGPVKGILDSIETCNLCCGVLFKKMYREGYCPCYILYSNHKNLKPAYVKNIFWAKIEEIHG